MAVGIHVYMLFCSMVLLALVPWMDAGCREHGCCRGDDYYCHTEGARANRPDATSCFCDETCVVLGDCCTDYHDVCPAEDCEMDDWEEWGECSETCGWGHKTRQRRILREGKYGGKKCETTVQKTYCLGTGCKSRRHNGESLAISETSSIIPAEYGSWRKDKAYDPYNGINGNLFRHYAKDERATGPSFCARFEIVETRKACGNALAKSWAGSLELGQEVCVECQPSAMRKRLGFRCKGEGAYLIETRWNAVTVPGCHGKWKRITERREECSCNSRDDHSFILV